MAVNSKWFHVRKFVDYPVGCLCTESSLCMLPLSCNLMSTTMDCLNSLSLAAVYILCFTSLLSVPCKRHKPSWTVLAAFVGKYFAVVGVLWREFILYLLSTQYRGLLAPSCGVYLGTILIYPSCVLTICHDTGGDPPMRTVHQAVLPLLSLSLDATFVLGFVVPLRLAQCYGSDQMRRRFLVHVATGTESRQT